MDKSEQMRKEFQLEFCKKYGPEIGAELLTVIDRVMYHYTIESKDTSLATTTDNVKSVLEDYLSCITTNGIKTASAKNWFYTIREFLTFTALPLNCITAKECRAYVAHLQERNKDTTVSNKVNTINRFFVWCVEEEYLIKNPVTKVKVKHGESDERKPLTDTESVHLELSCETTREKAICEFFASTGCRVSELSKVRIEDIDFRSRKISILNAKGGKNRTVMFGAELEIALQQYIDEREGASPFLFVTERAPHRQMSPNAIREEFEKVVARSAINRKVTPHYMRHTFITNLLNKGAPINEVALLAGHASVNTTAKVYAHIALKKLENTYSQYS